MDRITTEAFVKNMDWKERKIFAKKLQNWLGHYTNEVIASVMEKFEDIINNPQALQMIDELYTRSKKEREDEIDTFEMYMGEADHFKQFNIHNHCLEHSGSYRDVLYDMYIR